MATIQILGTGCSKCAHLQKNAELAVKELGRGDVVEKIDDIVRILDFSPSALPAMAIDGRDPAEASQYVAIFYHAKHRCDTCRKIEEYAHSALQPAIDAGEITWEVSEYTAPENRDVVRSMDVMTSTVVLAERENGRIVRFQNLEDVWLHTDDPERFASFINDSWKSFRENL